jgi:hypothetical protein
VWVITKKTLSVLRKGFCLGIKDKTSLSQTIGLRRRRRKIEVLLIVLIVQLLHHKSNKQLNWMQQVW